jgi:hypothetical protein
MSVRSRFIIVLVVVGMLLSGGVAQAADYVVEIGADTRMGKDAGSLICRFDQTCHGELKALGLQVAIDLRRNKSWIASLRIYGHDIGCCYFWSGRDKAIIDPRDALHQLSIFKGAGERGGMVIENEYVGALYLKFRVPSLDRGDDKSGSEQPI